MNNIHHIRLCCENQSTAGQQNLLMTCNFSFDAQIGAPHVWHFPSWRWGSSTSRLTRSSSRPLLAPSTHHLSPVKPWISWVLAIAARPSTTSLENAITAAVSPRNRTVCFGMEFCNTRQTCLTEVFPQIVYCKHAPRLGEVWLILSQLKPVRFLCMLCAALGHARIGMQIDARKSEQGRWRSLYKHKKILVSSPTRCVESTIKESGF